MYSFLESLLFLLLKALGVQFHNRFSLAIDQQLIFLLFCSVDLAVQLLHLKQKTLLVLLRNQIMYILFSLTMHQRLIYPLQIFQGLLFPLLPPAFLPFSLLKDDYIHKLAKSFLLAEMVYGYSLAKVQMPF